MSYALNMDNTSTQARANVNDISSIHLGSSTLIPLSMPSEQKSGTIMSLSTAAPLHLTTLSRNEVAKVLLILTICIPVPLLGAKNLV